jgi:FkbM family methyltransferase
MSIVLMNICLDGSLEKWLEQQLAARPECFAGKPILLDVGAHHGNFSARFLATSGGVLQRAVLFEPNPGNFQALQKRFAGNAAVRLEPLACDVETGEHKFFCAGESYTGSLLRYNMATTTPPRESIVRCVRLDDFLVENGMSDKVGLLKIDTQGNDLSVLKGATALLRDARPWISCELIYLPLYESQCVPHELAAFLAENGFVMAAQFNECYTETGWLAWADACFVPREIIGAVSGAFHQRPVTEVEPKVRRTVAERVRRQMRRTLGRSPD